MIRESFWTGVGLGNFQWVFPLFQPAKLIYGWDHAHNDYLEMAAELGIPAASLLILFFAGLWIHVLQQADRKDFSSFVLILGGLTGMGALVLHGFTDFNFSIPANQMCFVLIAGLVTRLLQFERHKIMVKKNYE